MPVIIGGDFGKFCLSSDFVKNFTKSVDRSLFFSNNDARLITGANRTWFLLLKNVRKLHFFTVFARKSGFFNDRIG
jgi:hypothetical protein